MRGKCLKLIEGPHTRGHFRVHHEVHPLFAVSCCMCDVLVKGFGRSRRNFVFLCVRFAVLKERPTRKAANGLFVLMGLVRENRFV